MCGRNAGRPQSAAALPAHRAAERVTASPAASGRRHLDRPVADPDGAPIAAGRIVCEIHDIRDIRGIRGIRDIRDEIDARITELLTQLAP